MAIRTGADAEPNSAATGPAPIEVDLGARIRTLRVGRGETLRKLAAQAGVTESFLSQVERGVASPSIASVQRIARALGTSIAELFAADDRAGIVVRAADRRRVVYQGLGAVDEFLTRATDGRLQVIMSTIQPGGGTGDEAYTHDSDEEVVVVLDGRPRPVGWAGALSARDRRRRDAFLPHPASQHEPRARRRARPVLHHAAIVLISIRPYGSRCGRPCAPRWTRGVHKSENGGDSGRISAVWVRVGRESCVRRAGSCADGRT